MVKTLAANGQLFVQLPDEPPVALACLQDPIRGRSRLSDSLRKARQELPAGWRIFLVVEHDNISLRLLDRDNNLVSYPGERNNVADEVEAALTYASYADKAVLSRKGPFLQPCPRCGSFAAVQPQPALTDQQTHAQLGGALVTAPSYYVACVRCGFSGAICSVSVTAELEARVVAVNQAAAAWNAGAGPHPAIRIGLA